MVYESIDHGNDVNNAVPVVLFLVFHKNKCYCKKQIDPHFPWFSIDNRNDAIKRSKLCSETTRLQLVVILTMEKCGRFVKCLFNVLFSIIWR